MHPTAIAESRYRNFPLHIADQSSANHSANSSLLLNIVAGFRVRSHLAFQNAKALASQDEPWEDLHPFRLPACA